MKKYKLMRIALSLFGDGGGDGAATAGGDGAATQGEGASAPSIPGYTHREKTGDFDNVLFGKQDDDSTDAGDAGQQATEKPKKASQSTPDDKRKAFQDLINGDYKDQYTEATQRIIDKRFKETKTMQSKLDAMQPLIDMLMQKHGVTDGDMAKLTKAIEADDSYWEDAADEAGMSVDQYRQFQKLQRENEALKRSQQQRQAEAKTNAQVEAWKQQAQELKQRYPDFDLETEVQNPGFARLLQAGIPVSDAYTTLHLDDIVSGAIRTASMQAEKRVTDNIRARGNRPAENASQNRSAFQVRDDVSKLTKADRAEAIRRAARGETIRF